MNLKIRQLNKNDWEDYKRIRLEGLSNYPSVFLSSLEEESSYSRSRWQDDLDDSSCALFGVYNVNEIVGLTAVFTWRGDETKQTAFLAMSYRNPDYRKCGVGEMFYKARIQWAVEQPQLTKIRVSHRENNTPSKDANQKAGFNYVGKEMICWPDGRQDWGHNYELDLLQLRHDRKIKPLYLKN